MDRKHRLRRYLRRFETKKFVYSYVYDKPFDLENALLSARPDLINRKTKELTQMGEVILRNQTVTSMISDEFEKILKESEIGNVKKKFLDVILKAEEIAEKENNPECMLNIAKMWGQMAAEYGLKRSVTSTGEANGKLSDETLDKLKDGHIKVTKTIITESGG